MAGRHFAALGKGRVRRDVVSSSNIYAGMVTRNLTEPTYTTSVDGTAISQTPGGRTITGYMDQRGGAPTFAARQPKGMLMRSQKEGPSWVSTGIVDPQGKFTVKGQ